MANTNCRDPYRQLMYERGDSRPKITLPRVKGAEEGESYTTIPFTLARDDRGAHMREKVMKRRWRG